MKKKGMSQISGVLVGVLTVLVSVFGNVPQSAAQTVTGRILGTIRDQQGAVVPNASVTARNVETGAERSVSTDASGSYSIVSVPAGTYGVTASAQGFRTDVRSGVILTVGASLRVDFTLTLGAVTEIVEVTAEVPQVDTTTSALGGVINESAIEALPLNARDWLQLPLLQAGVVSPQGARRSAGRGFGERMSVSGGRVSQNAYRMDGLVMNNQTQNTPGSMLGVNLGVDAIREFSVLTTSYSAEYGRASGGVINAITKSGTNALHGTGFYFHRNSRLDEKNFFDDVDEPIAPFRRHQFGASLGGPVIRDKLFFFSNYEGLRQFLSVSLAANTLSPNARNGTVCADRTCTTTTTVEIDPRVRPYLALYPEPNGQITGNTGRFFKGAGVIGREDYGISKIDYLLSDNTTLTGQYTIDDASNGTPGDLGIHVVNNRTFNQRAVLSLQHVFSPTVLNIIRGGVNRANAAGIVEGLVPGLTDPALGFVPGQFVGLLNVTGIANVEGPGVSLPDTFQFTSFQLYDDLAWVKGRHNIRIGFSVEGIRNNGQAPPNLAGQWRFGSIRDFLTVTDPRAFSASLPGSTTYFGLRTKVFGGYIQDDFLLSPRLTLNLGLRYEPQTAVSEINGRIATILRLTDTEPNHRSKIYENPTLWNFAPRVGFAWDPFGTGKTAVRGGFGKYDILSLPNLFLQRLSNMYPINVAASVNRPPASSFPNRVVDLISPTNIQGTFIEPEPSAAYKLQWNLNIQRQIAAGLSITAGYVGSKAVHLPNQASDINMVPPNLTRFEDGHLRFPKPQAPVINPFWSRITLVQWDGYSTYHGLQVNVSKQMSHGFTMQSNYTWSKSIDVGSVEIAQSELANGQNNPYPLLPSLFRGVSDFDIPHRLSVNFLWAVPSPNSSGFVPRLLLSGWELSGIFQAQQGSPFNLLINEEVAGTGAIAGRSGNEQHPDFVPGAGCSSPGDTIIPVNNASPGRDIPYVKLECFRYPERFTWGNLGRNALRGPGLVNFDFSIGKNHRLLDERLQLQLRVEFFNLFNRHNFGIESLEGFNAQGLPVPSGVVLSSTATRAREIQLGTKLIW